MFQRENVEESKLIEALASALEEFASSTLDDSAAREAKRLLEELKHRPESAVEKISQAFNSPKTAITDLLSQGAVREKHKKVESTRKALGNLYALRRISARSKS